MVVDVLRRGCASSRGNPTAIVTNIAGPPTWFERSTTS
jgi:hypothetical protein